MALANISVFIVCIYAIMPNFYDARSKHSCSLPLSLSSYISDYAIETGIVVHPAEHIRNIISVLRMATGWNGSNLVCNKQWITNMHTKTHYTRTGSRRERKKNNKQIAYSNLWFFCAVRHAAMCASETLQIVATNTNIYITSVLPSGLSPKTAHTPLNVVLRRRIVGGFPSTISPLPPASSSVSLSPTHL